MRSKVFMVTIAALCVSSMVLATSFDGRDIGQQVRQYQSEERTNGTLGGFSFSIFQSGALQAQVDVGATTTGFATTTGLEAILLYGQVYDAPWSLHTFVTASSVIVGNTGQGAFNASFTFAVPAPDLYEGYGLVFAGFYPGTPGGTNTTGFWWSQYLSNYPGPTVYIDSTVPPTSTPDPNAGGIPVPTMNQWGVVAMVVLLIGVAMLIIVRRQ